MHDMPKKQPDEQGCMYLLCSICHLDIQGLHTAGTNVMLYRNKRHQHHIRQCTNTKAMPTLSRSHSVAGSLSTAPTSRPGGGYYNWARRCSHNRLVRDQGHARSPLQEREPVGVVHRAILQHTGLACLPMCWCISSTCSMLAFGICGTSAPCGDCCACTNYLRMHQLSAHARTICACTNYLRMQGIAA
jgi:hypothetical protein